MHPDVLIIQDPTLLHQVGLFDGAGDHVLLLINSERQAAELGIEDFTSRLRPGAVVTVPATELAQQHTGRPVPNAALLGAFAALTGAVSARLRRDCNHRPVHGRGWPRQRRGRQGRVRDRAQGARRRRSAD